MTNRAPRDDSNWAKPVDRLSASGVVGAKVDLRLGKARLRPAPGVRPALAEDLPRPARRLEPGPDRAHRHLEGQLPHVLARRRAVLCTAWRASNPAKSRCSTSRRCRASPVKLSTGVMVLYADDESFTFMTPEGHTLSAWITFSASREGDVTVAQAQALERTSDPFDELAYIARREQAQRPLLAADARESRDARRRGRADGRDADRLHRQAPAVASGAQRPQQRHASDGSPHADGAGSLDHPTRVSAGRR